MDEVICIGRGGDGCGYKGGKSGDTCPNCGGMMLSERDLKLADEITDLWMEPVPPHSAGETPSADRTSDAARSGAGGEEDWRDSPEYQAFLEACAKECRCTHSICDGVLAGGPCDEIIEDDRDEDNYPRDEDDEY